jgi:ADP-ribosyl-[dinitrogen reductase] hydrolase
MDGIMPRMITYRFNELELPNGGRLGLGCCPGHRLNPSPLAVVRQPGSLKDDLKTIAAWEPHVVLSLMEEPELASVGAPVKELAEELQAHGIDWQHLPIRDLGAPDERFETAWADLWPRLDLLFRRRGRVFIHCYAGLGRTGTVASLILMQYGFSARDALRAVRAARPGSIQSLEQEHYLSIIRQTRR